MDFLNSTYSVNEVVNRMVNFEIVTGESFFDFTLTQVNGKEIKVCREKEIVSGIVITDEYDLYIVKDEIGILIKRESVMNMFDNFEDFISEHTKEEIE